MLYITWRQLMEQVQQHPELLNEPVLFAHTDMYGEETIVPAHLIQDTWHPADASSTLYTNESTGLWSRSHPDNAPEPEEGEHVRALPRGALLLAFDETNDDPDETTDWLRGLLPATPPPGPVPPLP